MPRCNAIDQAVPVYWNVTSSKTKPSVDSLSFRLVLTELRLSGCEVMNIRTEVRVDGDHEE